MTQLFSPPAISAPVTRLPRLRVTQQAAPAVAGGVRSTGLWVPAQYFKRGMRIVLDYSSGTTSVTWSMYIGGLEGKDGVANLITSAPASSHGAHLVWSQDTDGAVVTFRTSGYFAGATSGVVTSAAVTTNLVQPLNFVGVSNSGGSTCEGLVLEVIPADTPFWQYGHNRLVS